MAVWWVSPMGPWACGSGAGKGAGGQFEGQTEAGEGAQGPRRLERGKSLLMPK